MSEAKSTVPVGIISKGIKFILGTKEIAGLMEAPEMGATREAIDVTTLEDSIKRSIFGIGDAGELAFKFLYDNSGEESNYRLLKAAEETVSNGAPVAQSIKIELPDGTAVDFTAVVSVKLDSVGVNAAMTFTCTALLQSEMKFTNPA